MCDDWKIKRKAIKKEIIETYNIYHKTNEEDNDKLNTFLEFVIDNYDLDDELFNKLEQDLDIYEDTDYKTIEQIEDEEYRFNVLNRRSLC